MLRVSAAAAALATSVLVALSPAPAVAGETGPDVLVFTKTAEPGRPHADTPEAVELIEMTARRYGFQVDATDDAGVFTADRLAGYDAVLWLNTAGDVLDTAQQDAFQDWIGAGGGFLGVHSAARTETDWEYYHDLVGAFAVGDEDAPTSEQDITVATEHPAAAGMPETWEDQTDQWYTFDRDPAGLPDSAVLATVSLHPDTPKLPVAWCQKVDGGRSWYTSMGHSVKTFEDGDFMRLLRGGIWWVTGTESTPMISTADTAPEWPYAVSFLAMVAAVAVGGGVAVSRLNRREAERIPAG